MKDSTFINGSEGIVKNQCLKNDKLNIQTKFLLSCKTEFFSRTVSIKMIPMHVPYEIPTYHWVGHTP